MKCIYWRERGNREVFRDLAADYNTDNYTEDELNEFISAWCAEDQEDGLDREYFVE